MRVRRAIRSDIAVSPALVAGSIPAVTRVTSCGLCRQALAVGLTERRAELRCGPVIPRVLLLTAGCQQMQSMIAPVVMSNALPPEIWPTGNLAHRKSGPPEIWPTGNLTCMRLATWNCSMALHRKFDAMLGLQPDIAIICECAEPKRLHAWAIGVGAATVW